MLDIRTQLLVSALVIFCGITKAQKIDSPLMNETCSLQAQNKLAELVLQRIELFMSQVNQDPTWETSVEFCEEALRLRGISDASDALLSGCCETGLVDEKVLASWFCVLPRVASIAVHHLC